MKKCLQCEQVYGDETNFCLSDGSTLVSVSGSFTAHDETPTVYSGISAPTNFNNPPLFTAPVSLAQPAPNKSRTLLIVAIVALFMLLIGGAVIGLVVYGLNSSSKKDTNGASNSNDKSNKNASAEQKADNDNLAENLKQQQEKLEKDRQKLENDRKALEAKKKETPLTSPPTSSATTAVITDPPTNIRAAPNGTIICVMRQRGTVVNILGSTGVRDNNGTWYYTDACGRRGVIHSSQIRF
ncbi:MAG TPA: hypothetical protein VGC97_22760 [Pyrinomonadaceae bacterium]|jgi:hypothetical protein